MERYYSLDSEFRFSLFSMEHVSALLLILTIMVMIFLVRDRVSLKVGNCIRLSLAVLLIVQELALQLWDFANGIWSIQSSLPLHLCGISLLLTSVMLFTKNRSIYQVAYFWGIAGASQALITPDIYYGFPHFIFFQFFTAHGLIVIGCLWMTLVEGCRPSLTSLAKALAFTNLYALLIGAINYLTGSNYLYLCHKPYNPSLLDYLGAWPWYIVSLEIAALLFFLLSALPFLWTDIQVMMRRSLGI